MSIQKTTTDLTTLKINYLTQAMYEDALENDEIEENELYMSPYESNYNVNIQWTELYASDTVTPTFHNQSSYYYYTDSVVTAMDFPDYLKVNFNNTEYICEKQIISDTYVYYGATNNNLVPAIPSANSIDFTNYPFSIAMAGSTQNTNKLWQIWVETGDSFTLQIDRGYQNITTSSDFEQVVLYIFNGGNN